jgi:hypothetical protein
MQNVLDEEVRKQLDALHDALRGVLTELDTKRSPAPEIYKECRRVLARLLGGFAAAYVRRVGTQTYTEAAFARFILTDIVKDAEGFALKELKKRG